MMWRRQLGGFTEWRSCRQSHKDKFQEQRNQRNLCVNKTSEGRLPRFKEEMEVVSYLGDRIT